MRSHTKISWTTASSLCPCLPCTSTLIAQWNTLSLRPTDERRHFTITLICVTARSVETGAYFVPLRERAVQVEGQPIILTSAPALNKVLGHEVYTSNLQLGSTQNGVSHLTAGTNLQGATNGSLMLQR